LGRRIESGRTDRITSGSFVVLLMTLTSVNALTDDAKGEPYPGLLGLGLLFLEFAGRNGRLLRGTPNWSF